MRINVLCQVTSLDDARAEYLYYLLVKGRPASFPFAFSFAFEKITILRDMPLEMARVFIIAFDNYISQRFCFMTMVHSILPGSIIPVDCSLLEITSP